MAARILVVEDDSLIREVLDMALREEGYAVDQAADGVAALEYLSSKRPDLVVLDLSLPRLDGYQVCQMIRRQPPIADVPVLVVSAMASTAAIRAAYRAGADAYLDKPFDISDLVGSVQALLKARVRPRVASGDRMVALSSPVRG